MANQVTRLANGILLSDAKETDAPPLTINLSDEVVSEAAFKNVINTSFDLIELPFEVKSKIEELEEKVQSLEELNIDAQGDTAELLTERAILQDTIDTSNQNIITLQEQIENLNKRFSITPTEGSFIMIPITIENSKTKEHIEYWFIENGQRRRVLNYCMLQVMLSQRKKSYLEVQVVEPSNIAKIQRGPDIPTSDFAYNWDLSNAINNPAPGGLWLADVIYNNGTIPLTLSYQIYGGANPDFTNSVSPEQVIAVQSAIVTAGWFAPGSTTLLLTNLEDIRPLLSRVAWYWALTDVNKDISIVQTDVEDAQVTLNQKVQTELTRIRYTLTNAYSGFINDVPGMYLSKNAQKLITELQVAYININDNKWYNTETPPNQALLDILVTAFTDSNAILNGEATTARDLWLGPLGGTDSTIHNMLPGMTPIFLAQSTTVRNQMGIPPIY